MRQSLLALDGVVHGALGTAMYSLGTQLDDTSNNLLPAMTQVKTKAANEQLTHDLEARKHVQHLVLVMRKMQ